MMASANGNLEIVKLLIEKWGDVNVKDNEGETALKKASKNRHKKIVKLLKVAGKEK